MEKYDFWLWKVKNGTSSLHREMERPSKKVAWGEEKFVVTTWESLISKRRLTFIKNLTLQRDSRNIIRVKEREKNSPPTSVIIVIIWNTLQRIFLP